VFRVKSPQDLGAAVFFMLFGLAGVYFASDLAQGTAQRMGPGYFPTLLGWLIFGVGAILALRAFTIEGLSIERTSMRPLLFVLATILGFAGLIQPLGLVATSMIVVVVAAYARRNADLKEALLLAAGLTIFVVAAFVYGLSQPLPLWWSQ
jgi:hypothetical protein